MTPWFVRLYVLGLLGAAIVQRVEPRWPVGPTTILLAGGALVIAMQQSSPRSRSRRRGRHSL